MSHKPRKSLEHLISGLSARAKRHGSELPKVGLPPGSAIYTGTRSGEPVAISRFVYDAVSMREEERVPAVQCGDHRGAGSVTWVDVDGLHDVAVVAAVAAEFKLHPLVVEDILNPVGRPKAEDYGEYLYFVVKIVQPPNAQEGRPQVEQVSIVLGRDFVLTFQELPGDVFGVVRERIRQGTGRVRRQGADYLAYCLIDAVVDVYFIVLEHFAASIEALELEVLDGVRSDQAKRIYQIRREIEHFRRQISPLREVVGTLHRTGDELIRAETQPFLGDVYDHLVRVTESVDSFREAAGWALELHLAMGSHRMNEIMRVLTVMSAIFMPLTFVVGIYGMNFEHMPELTWRYGYFSVLFGMGVLAGGLIVFFRHKDWV